MREVDVFRAQDWVADFLPEEARLTLVEASKDAQKLPVRSKERQLAITKAEDLVKAGWPQYFRGNENTDE